MGMRHSFDQAMESHSSQVVGCLSRQAKKEKPKKKMPKKETKKKTPTYWEAASLKHTGRHRHWNTGAVQYWFFLEPWRLIIDTTNQVFVAWPNFIHG